MASCETRMQKMAAKMRVDFDNEYPHKSSSGSQREGVVRHFLQQHLPEKVGFTRGQVFAADDSISNKIDIILYDRLNCPLLSKDDGLAIVPVEAVYAVVEVSTNLNAAKLDADAQKIASVKRMPRRAFWGPEPEMPVIGVAFGINAPKNFPQAVVDQHNATSAFNERLDLVYTHEPEQMTFLRNRHTKEQAWWWGPDTEMPAMVKSGDGVPGGWALMRLFTHLANPIMMYERNPMYLLPYTGL